MSAIAAPAGYGFRAPRMEDLPEVLAVRNECERLVTGEDGWDETALRNEWGDPNWDFGRDSHVALGPRGEIVGWTEIYDRGGHALIELAAGEVLPPHRGKGVAKALLAWALRRASEEIHLADPDVEVLVRCGVDSREVYARRLLEAEEFAPVRHFHSMRIGLENEPGAPVWPEGIRVRSMRRPDDDEAFFAVKRESFLDPWGMAPIPFEEGLKRFRDWIDGDALFDPELFRGAWDGDELAGVCFTIPKWNGDPTIGDVTILGVRRSWRRRGLATALLRDAFALCRARGLVAVGLGVDVAGETRALDLYEKEGMRIVRRVDVWARVLRPGRRREGAGEGR